MVNASPTVRFDVLWRHGGTDAPIVSFTHQYPAGATAQYEETMPGAAVAAASGDLLVLRITMVSTDTNAEWVPFAEAAPTPTARWTSLDVP